MKILFLQNTGNVMGGISNVNNMLAEGFIKDNNNVFIICVRNSEYINKQKEIPNLNYHIVNENDIWKCPRYSEAIKKIKSFKLAEGLRIIFQRKKYDKKLKKDYRILANKIIEINPDVIINSHYELLEAIPKEYLSKTINHYHTTFGEVLKNRGQIKIFNEYKDKLLKFVWLSEKTCNEAIKMGIENSAYIYNPIKDVFIQDINVENRLIFLARFSPEKRLEVAIEIFEKLQKNNKLDNCFLDIYGIGEIPNELMSKIEKNKNINFKGKIDEPQKILPKYYFMLLTSSFEGFPLTVLEANQCGVPVIAFDFGETAKEVILKENGILVEQDNFEEYVKRLVNVLEDRNIRDEYSKNCKQWVEKFNLNNIKQQWYKLINGGK